MHRRWREIEGISAEVLGKYAGFHLPSLCVLRSVLCAMCYVLHAVCLKT